MYAWIVRLMIRRAIGRMNAGDLDPILSTYADDVHFVFPGKNSWAGDYRGKDEIERFLRRFVRAGLQFEPQEIIVGGPPWRTSVCIRYLDQAKDSDGTTVYTNRGIVYAQVVWGKIAYYEVYEDTEKVAEFDEYLASQGED